MEGFRKRKHLGIWHQHSRGHSEEYHLKRNMSGKRRKRPLKNHKFFKQKDEQNSINTITRNESSPELSVQSYPSHPKYQRQLTSIPIRNVLGIKIVSGDCYVTVLTNNHDQPMDLYFDCVPPHLIQQYLTDSWADLYRWTGGLSPNDYDPHDPSALPIYESKRVAAEFINFGKITTFYYRFSMVDAYRDRPYQDVPPCYACSRQISIFLYKVQNLLNKRCSS